MLTTCYGVLVRRERSQWNTYIASNCCCLWALRRELFGGVWLRWRGRSKLLKYLRFDASSFSAEDLSAWVVRSKYFIYKSEIHFSALPANPSQLRRDHTCHVIVNKELADLAVSRWSNTTAPKCSTLGDNIDYQMLLP